MNGSAHEYQTTGDSRCRTVASRLAMRIPFPRRAPLAQVLLAASATAFACSSPQLPTSTRVTVEEDVEGSADGGDPPAPAPEAPPPAAAPSLPEEQSIVGETSGPARLVLETANEMYEEETVVRGSCHDYVSAVFDRAGFGGRRAREAVFQGPRGGPYADLDLIGPGDWLYIVVDPDARPVRTHSVLFVRWEDRSAGRALVFSYVGGRADRPANLFTRDVSRTYTILRARERR